jgi:hypothetical protein
MRPCLFWWHTAANPANHLESNLHDRHPSLLKNRPQFYHRNIYTHTVARIVGRQKRCRPNQISNEYLIVLKVSIFPTKIMTLDRPTQ